MNALRGDQIPYAESIGLSLVGVGAERRRCEFPGIRDPQLS